MVQTSDVAETRRLAHRIGEKIEHPLVIALKGDLGAGKTAFVQGLAKGLGVSERYYVTSPTFTFINEYPARLRLYHVDLYRIYDIEEVDDLGLDEILSADGVVAIEWADKFPEILPREMLDINIRAAREKTRRLFFSAYGRWPVNLLKEIGNLIPPTGTHEEGVVSS